MIDNSVLINIAISVLIGGIIIYYFSTRIVELNKKTNAMFEVVQALSKDNEQRKILEHNMTLSQQHQQHQQNIQSQSPNSQSGGQQQTSENELIKVSDNLNESDDESEDENANNESGGSDSDSVDDSEYDSDSEEESDNENEENEVYANNIPNGITVGSELLQQDNSITLNDLDQSVKVVDITNTQLDENGLLNNSSESEDSESDDSISEDSESEEILDNDNNEGNDYEGHDHEGDHDDGAHDESHDHEGDNDEDDEGDDHEGDGEIAELQIDDLPINVGELVDNQTEENSNTRSLGEKNVDVVDYKKTPVKILREIVKNKGLISDPSKVRKPELLKLLQSE